jgi:hypothetical protein
LPGHRGWEHRCVPSFEPQIRLLFRLSSDCLEPPNSLIQIPKIGQQSCLIEVKDSSAVFRLHFKRASEKPIA